MRMLALLIAFSGLFAILLGATIVASGLHVSGLHGLGPRNLEGAAVTRVAIRNMQTGMQMVGTSAAGP